MHSLRSVLLLALLGLSACSTESPPRPNVLLISIDSLRRDFIGVYGREPIFAQGISVSPNLDAFAAEATVFDDALTTTSWTLPSHMSLMTGMSDRWHGVEIDDFRRDPAHDTLAEAFQSNGYRTGGFYSGPYLAPKYGFKKGFDVYESAMMTPDDLALKLKTWMKQRAASGQPRPSEEVIRGMRDRLSHFDITSPKVNHFAQDFIKKNGDEPFFLFLHYFDAHYDYLPQAGLAEVFDPAYKGQMSGENWYFNPAVRNFKPPYERRISDRDLAHIEALYEAEIHWVDRHVGHIFEQLKSAGLWENTIVAVLSDHGDEFFEHGSIGHRSTLYTEQMRIPMILRIPGIEHTGRRETGLARIYDLGPTLLDYARLDGLALAEGSSLRGVLDGSSTGRSALGRLYFGSPQGPNIQDSWRNSQYAVIRSFHVDGRNSSRNGLQLVQKNTQTGAAALVFDRREDPLELKPLSPKDPRYAKAMESFQAAFSISESGAGEIPHSALQERYGPKKSQEEQLMLNSLGYTSSSDNPAEVMRAPPLKPFPKP